MKGIIIVLGAPNSDKGELSEMAQNRLDSTINFYLNNPGFKILCTGGFGPHFNSTAIPHAEYAARYLMQNHIPAHDIIEYALSSNTMEDAALSKPILETYQPNTIVVITSDFHMKRASLIFNRNFVDYNLFFVEAISTLDKITLDTLKEHEIKAIERLNKTFG